VLEAAILCGGLGTRLQALGSELPKAMMPVAGRPFLEYLVRDLARQGAERIVLCTGYRRQAIEAHFGRGDWGARIAFAAEPEPLGTAGALRLALAQIEGESFLALNGDSFTRFDLPALPRRARETGAPIVMVVAPASARADAGTLRLDASGDWVQAFAEKQPLPDGRFHSAGIYWLRRDVLAALPAGRAVSLEHEVFPAWLARGIAAVPALGEIVDIGTPERLARAQQLLAAG